MSLRHKGHFVPWLGILLALSLMPSPGQAQAPNPVAVRVAPASSQVSAAQSVDVALEVVDVEELYGFDVTVTFDPQAVEVVDADPSQPGIQVGQGLFLDAGFAVINIADNAEGSVHFVMTQLNPSEPKSGTGSLIVVKLRGKQVGASSPLAVVNPQLSRRDGFMIPATGVTGQIDVVASEATTSTPMPTQGAGTPMAEATPDPTLRPILTTPQPTAPPATAAPEPTDSPVTATPEPATPPAAIAAAVGSPTRAALASPTATATSMPDPTLAATADTPTAAAEAAPMGVAAQPTASPVPTVEPSAPAAVALAPRSTPAAAATRAVPAPSRTAGRVEGGASPDWARVFLWMGIGVGGLAVVAGIGALLLWLQGRR